MAAVLAGLPALRLGAADRQACSSSSGRLAVCPPHRPLALARPPRAQRLAVPRVAAPEKAPAAEEASSSLSEEQLLQQRLARQEERRREQLSYQITAVVATVGVASIATFATYYRIVWHMANSADGSFPLLDLACTLLLAAGAAAGMEMYARWVHRVMWHENETGWILHKSHHEPRTGPFELNDIYALVNAIPAMSLCLYGFLREDLVGGLCFGAGLGITLFGISYMFVHDGLVHRRFPVGPIADVPALKRITLAHQLHHSEKYGGVPFGMFLGPQELEMIGATAELDRMMAEAEAQAAQEKAAAGN